MSVEADWKSYLDNVVPKNAGADQVMETRRAFYAGSWAMLQRLQSLGDDAYSEAQGVVMLEMLSLELKAFLARLGINR